MPEIRVNGVSLNYEELGTADPAHPAMLGFVDEARVGGRDADW